VTPTASDLRRARLLWDYLRLGVPARPAECLLVLGGHDIGVASRTAELYGQGMAPLVAWKMSWPGCRFDTRTFVVKVSVSRPGCP
jgi:hypothetical protein